MERPLYNLHKLPPFASPRPLFAQQLRIWRTVLDLSPQKWQVLKGTPLKTLSPDDPTRETLLHLVAYVNRFSTQMEAQQHAAKQLELSSSGLHQRYLQGDRSALSELIAIESPHQPWIVADQWYKAAVLRELRLALPSKKRSRPSQPGGKVQSFRDAVSRKRALDRWVKKYESFCQELGNPEDAKQRTLSLFKGEARIKDPQRKAAISQQLRKVLTERVTPKN